MDCIVAEKEKSHLEFLCKKIFLSKKKEDGDSRVRLVPCFYCILEKPRRRKQKGLEKKRVMKTLAKYQTNPHNKPKLINKNIKMQTCALKFSISFRALPPVHLSKDCQCLHIYWLRCKIDICICIYGTLCFLEGFWFV